MKTILSIMARRIKHIAFLKFKTSCTAAEIAETWRLIEDLPKQIPGILDFTGGPNVSAEGLDQGFTHSFVMVFESTAARDAYLPHPEHQKVGAMVVAAAEGGKEGLAVVDWEV